MSSDIIIDIQSSFIKEAQNSPLLLSDLANLEKYISESYQGRSLIELLQNADDALATKFIIKKVSKNIYIVANNGRPFSNEDVISICRSGASTKQRKSNYIGFRGIGFKSVVNYASNVHLVSGEIKLTFSRDLTKRILPDVPSVPLIRIPHKLECSEYDNYIRDLHESGYITSFVFEVKSEELTDEMNDFVDTSMLFLQHIEEIELHLGNGRIIKYEIERKKDGESKYFATITSDNKKIDWLVLSDDKENINKCSLAFQINEYKKAVKLDKDEAVVHSFMPTKDYTCMPLKINGDFSTDPSRTKIVIDEETLKTASQCINLLAKLVVDIVLHREDPYNIIGVLAYLEKDALASFRGKRIGDILISEFQELFYKTLLKRLRNKEEIYLQPNWIDENNFNSICEKNNICGVSKNLERNIPGLLKFLSKMEISELPLKVAIRESQNIELSITSRAEIFAEIIKRYRFSFNESEKLLISRAKLLEFETGCKALSHIDTNEKLLPAFYSMLLDLVDDEKDLLWMLKKFNLYNDATGSFNVSSKAIMQNKTSENLQIKDNNDKEEFMLYGRNNEFEKNQFIIFKEKQTFQKWRSVEENIALVFNNMKDVIKVTDVSKSNLGYDLEVQWKDKISYIEIKSVNYLGDSFSMTNNEYATAVEFGEKYALAIVEQSNDLLKICMIYNPMNTLTLFKRVTRWEWVCNEYSGNIINIANG